jgi:tetratricopeptide repeat protein 21B
MTVFCTDQTNSNYEALARLVDLMRRSGKLEDVPKFLELAEHASARSPT